MPPDSLRSSVPAGQGGKPQKKRWPLGRHEFLRNSGSVTHIARYKFPSLDSPKKRDFWEKDEQGGRRSKKTGRGGGGSGVGRVLVGARKGESERNGGDGSGRGMGEQWGGRENEDGWGERRSPRRAG